MSTNQDQARSIAERVARRMKGTDAGAPGRLNTSASPSRNGAPMLEELSAIREGLHDLESKLDRIESKIVHSAEQSTESPRARVINFVSSGPPLVAAPAIAPTRSQVSDRPSAFVPPTHSPWVRDFSNAPPDHPSQERFGVEEAAVTELVEFFENEKKCSLDPSGKPCDHCAVCSSRGF